jgi:diguanylate cyclase (GGDEF)-like protein
MFEAALVAVVAIGCFITIGRLARRTVGWQLMRVSLALMTILYAAYVPLYALQRTGVTVPYLDSSSLADLLASVLLGFSMVLLAAEGAHRELMDAVDALQTARDQLAIKANTDPLTAALSRHAFHAMPAEMHGVVIMLDVDHLKQINDHDGHEAGDDAIRAVANAIRARIRADDLLFRWGGDEFLVVVPGSTLELVTQRLTTIENGVATSHGRVVTASWGAAAFTSSAGLDVAIAEADRLMYERRAAARITRAV